MAGIGEATAILTVVQLGIAVSKSLTAFVEDVKSAPSEVQTIGNDIATTSERLSEIGEIVGKNPETQILSTEAIKSTIRCSTECYEIIQDIKAALCKAGWVYTADDLNQEHDLEITPVDPWKLSPIRWPFVKPKLESNRVKLDRIKTNIVLIYSLAMMLEAHRASIKSKETKYMNKIPELYKSLESAEKDKREKTKMSRHQGVVPKTLEDVYSSEEESENMGNFLKFREDRRREKEQQRTKEKATMLLVEEEVKRKKEEETRLEIERAAIEQYKKEEQDREKLTAEKKESFQKQLQQLGISEGQIGEILKTFNPDFRTANGSVALPSTRPASPRKESHIDSRATSSTSIRRPRFSLPWRRQKRRLYDDKEIYMNPIFSRKSPASRLTCDFRMWKIDLATLSYERLHRSPDWLNAKVNSIERRSNMWNYHAELEPLKRNGLDDFISWLNEEGDSWRIYHVEKPPRMSRLRNFSKNHGLSVLYVITSKEVPRSKRKSSSRGDIHGKNTYRQGSKDMEGSERIGRSWRIHDPLMTRGQSRADAGVEAAGDFDRPKSAEDLRARIRRLMEERSKLDRGKDKVRYEDIDELIFYLQFRIQREWPLAYGTDPVDGKLPNGTANVNPRYNVESDGDSYWDVLSHGPELTSIPKEPNRGSRNDDGESSVDHSLSIDKMEIESMSGEEMTLAVHGETQRDTKAQPSKPLQLVSPSARGADHKSRESPASLQNASIGRHTSRVSVSRDHKGRSDMRDQAQVQVGKLVSKRHDPKNYNRGKPVHRPDSDSDFTPSEGRINGRQSTVDNAKNGRDEAEELSNAEIVREMMKRYLQVGEAELPALGSITVPESAILSSEPLPKRKTESVDFEDKSRISDNDRRPGGDHRVHSGLDVYGLGEKQESQAQMTIGKNVQRLDTDSIKSMTGDPATTVAEDSQSNLDDLSHHQERRSDGSLHSPHNSIVVEHTVHETTDHNMRPTNVLDKHRDENENIRPVTRHPTVSEEID